MLEYVSPTSIRTSAHVPYSPRQSSPSTSIALFTSGTMPLKILSRSSSLKSSISHPTPPRETYPQSPHTPYPRLPHLSATSRGPQHRRLQRTPLARYTGLPPSYAILDNTLSGTISATAVNHVALTYRPKKGGRPHGWSIHCRWRTMLSMICCRDMYGMTTTHNIPAVGAPEGAGSGSAMTPYANVESRLC